MNSTLINPCAGQYWTWREQKIYYVQAGTNKTKPPLLLVHGFGASTDHWRKNIEALSRDFEVWAIDLLGFGRSSKPNWQYSGALWREQLHDFITQAIARPVYLVGNSIGGYACLSTAAAYPQAAAGVILLNSAGSFTSPDVKSGNAIAKSLSSFIQLTVRQPLVNSLLFQFVKQKSQIRKTLLQVYVNKSEVTDRLVEDIHRPACDRGALDVFRSVFSTPQGQKVDELLSTLTCPLLAIWGESDPWMNPKVSAAKYQVHYPSISIHMIKSGHCPHDDSPELVNNLIHDWVIAN